MAIQVAAPSSSLGFTSSKTKYRYDVFLSFRGEDTRLTFTVRLHDALCRKGINAFIDDKKLAKGEEISPTLLKAIEKSRISIIVFSTNYATSTWCLEELARIVWCRKQKNQVVMPIFYKVDPLDVQKQRNSFGEAMADHKAGRFKNEQEKVQKWRAALHEAASLSPAWLFEDGCESGFIERIVEHAYSMIPPKRFQNIDHMVGLETRIEEVMSLMDKSDDRVCMLGIYGTGGIGKTTLAKALYKLIFYQFDGACFLFDVREESNKYQSIIRLQQTLLSEILGEQKMQLNSVDEGISYIKHRLSSKKVLLVLDDVDEFKQLEQLAGGRDWFGCGSKIIITTRNKELLIARNVEKTYEVKELSRLCSLELFCWHAFRMSQPPNGYENMSNHVIRYVHGLPLALKLVGSNLAHKDFEEWRSTLEQYKRIPERTIHEVLKISYDCLPDGAKRVFLDIACFFKKKALEFIEDILEACDDGARFYIEVLVDKSLITIDENSSRLYMHDLIQQMGKEIVRQEGPSNLGQRSRLWYYRDVLEVLQENSGSSNIEGIILDPPHQEKVEWGGIAFEKMNNLKILIIRNAQFSTSSKYFPNTLRLLDWKGYPSMTLPPNFSPSKLICLKLNGSQFTLEEPFKNVEDLDLSGNDFVSLPECIKECAYLERLSLTNCKRLRDIVELPSSLQHIAAENCMSLTMESIGRLWSQAKEGFAMEIVMPATTFPDWLDYCCKGAKLSFRVRGNMPRIVFAYQTGKANTKWVYMVEVFMSINGCNKMPWIQTDRVARKRGRVLYKVGDQGHVYFFDLLSDFSEELEELNKFLGLDWNDVDIQVTCDPPDLSIVNCGIYVDKRQTNMENIQFKSPLLSMNASTTSLKRKAIASHPNEPPRKHLRRFKEKTNYTNKTTRKSKRHQIFHSQYKRKMFFPMAKHLWRALYS
ncbi:disease resistance protein RUN1-like isoform X2 [Prosopis cineraria]|uniref:disease resistance protein RUN1-like isoform X2 n=1 Tax=Prosopis cineraria TaxID=364024 RepID=UPI00240EC954|nr:disease resistance protein RUN1-like isoform X2 [Prosopis cineraria]XP_054791332.1 disease resistance protein RUN1-like isoform X2 [Prosopis cineraria]